ncbi:MAG: zf-TFIIB domain-containing protein [Deltaproteobacteria bacterium]|nr:zf-TFIIB domain-containing protein [Deltaproteobacteria bacterium]
MSEVTPGERHCVVCGEVNLPQLVEDVEVYFCPRCHGLWLDRDEVKALSEKTDEALKGLREVVAKEPDESLGPVVERRCPACDGKLTIAALDGVHIRHCPECDGIFVERNELDRALKAMQSSDASTVVAVARSVVARGIIES